MNRIIARVACTSLAVIMSNLFAHSQEVIEKLKENPIPKVEKQLISLDLLFPGVGMEQRFLNTSTVKIYSRFKPSIGFSDNMAITWSQQFGVQFRYYYNLKDRMKLGRNVSKNSLNYLGIRPAYNFNYKDPDYSTITLSPMWGMQRSYNKWYLNAELGAEYYIKRANSTSQAIYPLVNLTLGYIIFNKK